MRMPSSRLTWRAVRKLSSSLIGDDVVEQLGSQAAGKKSSPTPSTRYGRPDPPENTEPSGSAAMILIAGVLRLEVPADAGDRPHVPAPATKWVIRPPVWRHSSGPVVCSWASGLFGLPYWLGRNASSSIVSRSATE